MTDTQTISFGCYPLLKRPIDYAFLNHKEDGNWARNNIEEAKIFSEHLRNIFQPNPPIGTG